MGGVVLTHQFACGGRAVPDVGFRAHAMACRALALVHAVDLCLRAAKLARGWLTFDAACIGAFSDTVAVFEAVRRLIAATYAAVRLIALPRTRGWRNLCTFDMTRRLVAVEIAMLGATFAGALPFARRARRCLGWRRRFRWSDRFGGGCE